MRIYEEKVIKDMLNRACPEQETRILMLIDTLLDKQITRCLKRLEGYFPNLVGAPMRDIAQKFREQKIQVLPKKRPALEVDAPVFVKKENGQWIPAHFYKWPRQDNDRGIYVWVGGMTSHTAGDKGAWGGDVGYYRAWKTAEDMEEK